MPGRQSCPLWQIRKLRPRETDLFMATCLGIVFSSPVILLWAASAAQSHKTEVLGHSALEEKHSFTTVCTCGLAQLPSFWYSDSSPRIRRVLKIRKVRITKWLLDEFIVFFKTSKIIPSAFFLNEVNVDGSWFFFFFLISLLLPYLPSPFLNCVSVWG